MSTTTSSTSVDEVRTLLDRYADAVRRLDLAAIAENYAPDIVAYDAIAQLEFAGRDSYLAHWKTCLECCKVMLFEPRPPTIHVSGNLAFGFYLVHCGGAGPDGEMHSGWMRATFAARKENGRWLIFHEHYSVPFDPVTEKMLTGLTPAAADLPMTS